MAKKFDPNVDLEKILPLTWGQLAAGLLAIVMLLVMSCMLGVVIFIPSLRRPDFGITQWIAVIVGSIALLTMAVIAIISIINRNVIGKECTVGIASIHNGWYHFHRAGLLMTDKQRPLIIYSHVRLGGWGNSKRLFPIYCLGTGSETEQTISPSLRVTADGRFELVQMQSKTCIGGPLYSLLVHAFHNAGGFDVFGAQTALNQSKNEVATLRRQLDWLGVPLVAVQHRLEVVRPAQQSQHAELTSDLCHIALENIPQAQQDAWLFTAQERWPHIFHERKKGDPKVTLDAPTPSAEVTA